MHCLRQYILFAIAMAIVVAAPATAQTSALDRVLNVTSKRPESHGISEVRAETLRTIGRSLGMRAGLADGSEAIIAQIEKEKRALDERFHFGSLTFPSGALPPVIEESKDVMSVMDFSFRLAGQVYRIISPARFGQVNWRDYLYLGLAADTDPLVSESHSSVYPRDATEISFWQRSVREAYDQGRQQAKEIFDLNLQRMERDFNGMRLYYELAARGLVSAPAIAAATESVSNPDPNTLIIGETMIRITQQPIFEKDGNKWKVQR